MASIKKMNLPNKLTLLRMIIVVLIITIFLFPYDIFNIPVLTFTLLGKEFTIVRIIVLILFIIGSVTDFLDGHIARKNNIVTTFGKFMDPIADKLLVNTLFVMLAWKGEIHAIIPIIMISRDTIVDAVRLVMMDRIVVIAASKLGKAKTVSQIVAIILMLINNVPFNLISIPLAQIACYIAALISLISGFDYFLKNKETLLEGVN